MIRKKRNTEVQRDRVAERLFLKPMQMPKSPDCLPEPFEWVYIPGGEVLLQRPSYVENVVSFPVDVEPFYMAKFPITIGQYAVYMQEIGRKPRRARFWEESKINTPFYPITDLLWHEAMAFCRWLSGNVGYTVLLPTDAQWQRAAQGD